MDVTETALKELIVKNYGSLKKFCENINMPWTTLDSILKRGVTNSNITNVMKITRELNIDTESLATGKIIPAFRTCDKFSLSDDERELIISFRNLNSEGKLKLRERTKELVELGYTITNEKETEKTGWLYLLKIRIKGLLKVERICLWKNF